jgi:hypothetical protein
MADHILIGKTITAVYFADDKQAIRFDVAGREEPIIARCAGDCCSHTWVENIENSEAIVGSPVLLAEDIAMPDLGNGGDGYDVIQYYGFKIETTKGTCIIDYRNSSNGYYGGNLSWPPDDYYYGGVFGQNASTEKWERIAG